MANHTIYISGFWNGSEDSGDWSSNTVMPSLTSYVDDGTDWALLFDEIESIKSKGNDTYSVVTDSIYGLSAAFSLLNGIIKVDVQATNETVRNTARDVTSIQTAVNQTKVKADDIYSVLTQLKDDFATFNQRYQADVNFIRAKFDDLDEQSTRIINYVSPLEGRIGTVIADIQGVNNNVGHVQRVVNNTYDSISTQSQEIKQKVDESKQGVLSSIRDALYASLRCVCALLEPIYILCRPSDSNSSSANISVAETGAVTVTASSESSMCVWTGTSQNFTVNVRQVEGYLPFESETGSHEYLYSDELKQVLALPYRR